MKMLVAIVGTVIRSSVKNGKGRSLVFNLKPVEEDDIYHIISMGPGQRQMLENLLQDRDRVDVIMIGHAFTYRSNKCQQHHFSVKPVFIVPTDNESLDALHDVISQWFTSSMLAVRRKATFKLN